MVKVNLSINGASPRSGYLNLDPLAAPGDALKTLGSVVNLDDHVDDAEADEIVALDVIDFLDANQVNVALGNWIRKIRHGGTIVVGGVDIREVAKAIVKQSLSISEANILLYGKQTAPYEFRKATLTLQNLIEVFQGCGLKVLQKRTEDYSYFVKAERP